MIQEPVDTQLYLTAPAFDAYDEGVLSAVLAEGVACLLADVSHFVEAHAEALERMIALADAAECPLVVGGDDSVALDLAKRFALDGVHLMGGPKQIEWARKQIGTDSIVGYGAGVSRHDAMIAAEGGADYVMLGPVAELDPELLKWWQAVIETPLVVDCVSDDLQTVAGVADFAMVSSGVFDGDAVAAVRGFRAGLSA